MIKITENHIENSGLEEQENINLSIETKKENLFIEPLRLIKEYLPLIVLLPATLGGLWQIAALASISIPYVRFFSVTQLIADGVLVILVVMPWLICAYLYAKQVEEFKIKPKKKKELSSKIRYYLLRAFLVLYLSLIAILIIYVLVYDVSKTNNELINYIATTILFFSIVVIFDLLLFNASSSEIFDKAYNSKIFKVPFIFLFTMIFLVIFPMFFNSKFFIPRNLENLENLDKYNSDKNAKLRYFNDKYIFIEHKKEDNSTTIQVVPFEELFDIK
ncbi:MAG: hypothetical protein PHI02_03665 [Sulfurovaceae bacterium]|nr:hypothetical protein [Sulfurovaceae bacterium]